jgi:hypothetical protein
VTAGERKNEALAVHLAAGQTVERAAELVGLSEATVYRRLRDPAFRRRVSELRAEMTDRALGTLSAAASAAVGTLCLLFKAKSESARLGAARAVLELGAKLKESTEFESRLRALEERLADKQSPGR